MESVQKAFSERKSVIKASDDTDLMLVAEIFPSQSFILCEQKQGIPTNVFFEFIFSYLSTSF